MLYSIVALQKKHIQACAKSYGLKEYNAVLNAK